MTSVTDPAAFDGFLDSILAPAPLSDPWGTPDRYLPDHPLLSRLLTIPVRQGAAQESGRFAKATDMWVAHELRRAGFDEQEVWPRRARPRVLPQALVPVESAVRAAKVTLPSAIRAAVRGSASVKLLGQYYPKQVDVAIAEWDRGAELIVSTKSMLSSYWNNLRNRFEEFVGDAKNLRGRYPLAAIGIMFVVRSTIVDERGAFDFAVDMLRRLRNPELYDAAGLVVAQWADGDFGSWSGDIDLKDAQAVASRTDALAVVTALVDAVPADVRPSRFLADIIGCVLSRTPVTYHVRARELREGRAVPVPEETQQEQAADQPSQEPPA